MTDQRAERIRLYVELRARLRCEYCRRPQPITGLTFHIEHVIPRILGGRTHLANLALACPSCNYHKSDRAKDIDPKTKSLARLFHPRRDKWKEHFKWSQDKLTIVGKTAIGRATVAALRLNKPDQRAFRGLWKERFQDLFPFE